MEPSAAPETVDPAAERGPGILHLAGVKIGTTSSARQVAEIIRGLDPEDRAVVGALDEIARACIVNPWTVYRWLLGLHVPRARQQKDLDDLAARLRADARPIAAASNVGAIR